MSKPAAAHKLKPFKAYRGDEPFVFVSYAHADADEVFADLLHLHETGLPIWYDEGIKPGTAIWKETIAERIHNCSYALGFLSPTAVESEWVVKEILLAHSEGKQLLTIHLEPTELPHALKLDLQFAQALRRYEESRDDYLATLVELLSHLVPDERGPLADFCSEVQFRLENAPVWTEELTAELLSTGVLLGLDRAAAEAALNETLEKAGIGADFPRRLEVFRQLVVKFVEFGEIAAPRRRILANRAAEQRIPPAQWENLVQQEALKRARLLVAEGRADEARGLLVSSVGEVVPQVDAVRSLLEDLELTRRPAKPAAATGAGTTAAAVPSPVDGSESGAAQDIVVNRARTRVTEGLDLGWVRVPAGMFERGCPEKFIRHIEAKYPIDAGVLRTYPVRREPLEEFWIGQTPVTNAQYHRFVLATGHRYPAGWRGVSPPYGGGNDDKPVTGVTWQDAVDFAGWIGARLPTRAELEKACRGADGRLFPWGNTFEASRCNTSESSIGEVTPVGRYPEGASAWGALDMVGNVWQWTGDAQDSTRMTVGASFDYQGEVYGAGFFDLSRPPESSGKDLGFRIAADNLEELHVEKLEYEADQDEEVVDGD